MPDNQYFSILPVLVTSDENTQENNSQRGKIPLDSWIQRSLPFQRRITGEGPTLNAHRTIPCCRDPERTEEKQGDTSSVPAPPFSAWRDWLYPSKSCPPSKPCPPWRTEPFEAMSQNKYRPLGGWSIWDLDQSYTKITNTVHILKYHFLSFFKIRIWL